MDSSHETMTKLWIGTVTKNLDCSNCNWNEKISSTFLYDQDFYFFFYYQNQILVVGLWLECWISYNWKSWSLRWRSKSSWHFSMFNFLKFIYKYIFSLSKLDSNHWIVTRLWIDYNQKFWPFKWQLKSSWNFSTIKFFFNFFSLCSWDWIQTIRLQPRCGLVAIENFGRSNGNKVLMVFMHSSWHNIHIWIYTHPYITLYRVNLGELESKAL